MVPGIASWCWERIQSVPFYILWLNTSERKNSSVRASGHLLYLCRIVGEPKSPESFGQCNIKQTQFSLVQTNASFYMTIIAKPLLNKNSFGLVAMN